MKLFSFVVPVAAVLLSATSVVQAGPISYAICQTGTSTKPPPRFPRQKLNVESRFLPVGCNIVAVACYGAAGATFGTVAAPLAPPAILACNAALGSCMALCAPLLIVPIP